MICNDMYYGIRIILIYIVIIIIIYIICIFTYTRIIYTHEILYFIISIWVKSHTLPAIFSFGEAKGEAEGGGENAEAKTHLVIAGFLNHQQYHPGK